jgi:glycosyltransferase involved in cell wall biosynthesis
MKQTGTEHVISLLGTKSNPYPYIANCDIYLQPSRYEGNSVTVREAQILCRPVIITNYATAKSQICNGFDGIICEMDNQSIANAIHSLATDSEKQQQLSTNLSASDFGNQSEVEKIYQLIL